MNCKYRYFGLPQHEMKIRVFFPYKSCQPFNFIFQTSIGIL